jgi:non-specific serine/threonine protein kinase
MGTGKPSGRATAVGVFSFADVQVDIGAHRLTRAGTEIGIEPKAFAVLVEFLGHPDQLLSRDRLLDAVWGHVYVTQATLNRLVVLLRRALGDDIESPRYIQTVRGLGYRFIATLTCVSTPAPPVLGFAPPVHARLPERSRALIGREQAIRDLRALLVDARLVTVTGPGGIGKTQAALETASQCAPSFPDGVWLFDFTLHTKGELLARTLADAFGIRDVFDVEGIVEKLGELLQRRHVLLVLDNCERAAEPLGHLVASLLSRCAELRVLVTSQQCLHCPGEMLYSLPALEAPAAGAWATAEDVARLAMVPAVQLLLLRSRCLASGFTLTPANAAAVAELCRRLDGLPLALELAAARLRLLSPEQLLLRMQHRFQWQADTPFGQPAHHQTLGALIDWSFALLSEQEQALLCALAVFAGGWTLDGAMAIGAVFELDGEQTLDLLGGLVDKSLITIDASLSPPRYSQLDSLRLFALARLGQRDDEPCIRRAHLAHCIDFTAHVDAEIRSERQQLWIERVLREQANLQAAFDYALSQTDLADSAITLGANLCWYFRASGEYHKASQWLDTALQATHARTLHRARALIANGIAHHHRLLHQRAIALLQDGIELAAQLGDDVLAASGQGVLAFELAGCDDFDGAGRCVEAALSVAEKHGSDWLRSMALLSRGIACAMRDQHRDAEACLSEAAELVSSPGDDVFQHGYVLINRALQRYQIDDVRGAATDWLRTLDMSIGLQHRRGMAGCIEGTAYLVLKRGDARHAALLAVAAIARELTGAPLFPHWYKVHAEAEARSREVLGEAFKVVQRQATAARFEDVVEQARALLTELAT